MSLIVPVMKPAIAASPPVIGLKNGLVACWELDEDVGTDVYDSHTNSIDGINYGADINFGGKTNKCYYFNSTDYVEFDAMTSLFNGTNQYISGAFWIKKDDWTKDAFVHAKFTNLNGSRDRPFYSRVYSNGVVYIFFGDNTSSYGSWTTSAVITESNVWHHVAFAVDLQTETCIVWVDGVSQTVTKNGTIRNTLYSSPEPMTIGRIRNSDGSYSYINTSYVDQVILWNRLLTQAEATQLANVYHYSNW